MARPPKGGTPAPSEDPGAIEQAAQALQDSQKGTNQIAPTDPPAEDAENHDGNLPSEEEDHIAAMDRALARLGETIDRMELAGGSLVVDLRDTILELIKRWPKPWTSFSQQEKRDAAKTVEELSQKIVKEVSQVIASIDRPATKAILGSITVGDKVEAKIKIAALPEDQMAETIGLLYHLKGKTIMLISADDQVHMQNRRPAVEPDEPSLPFVGDADEARAGEDADDRSGDADREGADDDEEDERETGDAD
jgi:hypothetical protein